MFRRDSYLRVGSTGRSVARHDQSSSRASVGPVPDERRGNRPLGPSDVLHVDVDRLVGLHAGRTAAPLDKGVCVNNLCGCPFGSRRGPRAPTLRGTRQPRSQAAELEEVGEPGGLQHELADVDRPRTADLRQRSRGLPDLRFLRWLRWPTLNDYDCPADSLRTSRARTQTSCGAALSRATRRSRVAAHRTPRWPGRTSPVPSSCRPTAGPWSTRAASSPAA